MNDVTTKPRLTERQKRSVPCPTCSAEKGKACRGSRIPGANTLGGGWGGPPNLDRAHDARREVALKALIVPVDLRNPRTPEEVFAPPTFLAEPPPAPIAQPRSIIIGEKSPSSKPIVWIVGGERFVCERQQGACPFCCKRAVFALPEPLRAIQPDGTTHVCVEQLGGCNQGFEDTSPNAVTAVTSPAKAKVSA